MGTWRLFILYYVGMTTRFLCDACGTVSWSNCEYPKGCPCNHAPYPNAKACSQVAHASEAHTKGCHASLQCCKSAEPRSKLKRTDESYLPTRRR
eukprot:2290619-Amphidinium_carterae.2